ncbi:serine-type D-Ala-D-Ala carboxypeptidase [Aliivibrio sp. S4TY2]|uniref:serine-type D-Ala-D-Ala carboxypeptidase n=1 Tax=unclassified Aliivibrio TaxID=2645654 RepID=UPI002378FEE2|nr:MULTISPECIES: serine-type D-Ala-D-Ala carboxypeptidase [unclassified Aliivibrio]MDD9157270.1 serine-type D-Ala-D-Ala carboxypeptidase [Aliivibrio sp. S4TY2]MDD9161152.1 serine-type D-Ala-D-Ala carboxypeptidase [Aliivibrio sp. S4TY1]MDD9165182.1 serine-type D-Ala-D-Ala carboxypeptidase [Aliivibrio sp. S4MY2]MDD9169180.1 serine-type D-Ala-D-Ala carboxypeptidase [Aliivibrio sp. S4MY4]MDD9185997.1 serine-type D-Ala-D-Ala carboxypeptidase [Aliivibrio sp. S4MY3]
MFFSRYTLIALSLISFSSIADIKETLSSLPSGSRTAITVENLQSNKIEFQQKQDELLPPASTLKIATALAARLALGKEFSFETSLYKADKDIVLTFTGDPSLSRKQLSSLFDEGDIKTIQGDLWIDGTIFTGYERAVGWPWDILGVCYSAPSSAFSIDENCVQASITTHDDGSTRVFVPIHQPISFSSYAKSVSREEQESTFCDLELTTQGNHYELNGCLVNRNKPLPLKFAVQDTQDFTEQTVLKILNEHNIKLNGEVRFGKPDAPVITGNKLAMHSSKPLMELLDHMLKKSDNHYADNLTKMLGHLNYQQAGSFTNGTAAIKDILLKQANIDLSNAVLVDGSGLSRNNRMTANQMTSILQYLYKHDKELGLIDLLPISGIDGTLKYRNSMRKEPIKGSMKSKSGSLFGSYNMAGFVGLENQAPQLFVQFVADYHPVAAKEGATPVERPIDTFEKNFYQELIELSKD